jgi:hypothetical protein
MSSSIFYWLPVHLTARLHRALDNAVLNGMIALTIYH